MKALFELDLEKTLKGALEVALEQDLSEEDQVLQGLIKFLTTRLEEARKTVGQLPEKSLFHLFHLLGVSAPQPKPARTVVVFSVSEKAEEPLVLRQGFPVSKEEIIFETQEEALLLPGSLEKVLFYLPKEGFLAQIPATSEREIKPSAFPGAKRFELRIRFSDALLQAEKEFDLLLDPAPQDLSWFVEGRNGKKALKRNEKGYFRLERDLLPFEDEKGKHFWLVAESGLPVASRRVALLPGPAKVEHLFGADRPLLKEHFFFPVLADRKDFSWIPSFFPGEEHFWLKNPFGQPPLPGVHLWLGGFWLLPGTKWTIETTGQIATLEHLNFEYFDGKGWKALRPHNGTFSFPEDLAPTTANQIFSRWLRIRYVGPLKARPTDEDSVEEHFLKVSVFPVQKEFEPEEIKVFNLGEEAPGLPQKAPLHGLSLEEAALYLPLKKAFPGGPVSLYFIGEGEGGFKRLEVSSPSGWVPLAFEDTTDGLKRPGFFRFYLPEDLGPQKIFGEETTWLRLVLEREKAPRLHLKALYLNALTAREGETLRHLFRTSGTPEETFSLRPLVGEIRVKVEGRPYLVVDDLRLRGPEEEAVELDPEKGLLTLGDGHHGKVPPPGATLEVRYVSHHGEAGNLPPQSLKDFPEPLSFLEGVSQPEPAVGGRTERDPSALGLHLPARIRHRNRAVTAQDLRDILEDFDEIRRLYFETHQGKLRLYLLPYAEDEAPKVSQALRQIVRERLLQVLPLTLTGFEIRDPLYVPLHLKAQLIVSAGVSIRRALSRAREALLRFLHPVLGNFDGQGFPFGHLPLLSDLYRLLQELPEIRAVKELEVFALVEGRPQAYREGRPPRLPAYVLPTPGEISLKGESDESQGS